MSNTDFNNNKDPFADLDFEALYHQVQYWLENAEICFGWAKPHITHISIYERHPKIKEPWRYAIVVDTKPIKTIKDKKGLWQKVPAPTNKTPENIFKRKAFKSVYKNKPVDDSFVEEWLTQIRPHGSSVYRIPDESAGKILYEISTKTDTASPSNASTIMSTHFGALSHEALKTRAIRWAKKYYKNVPIKSIKLYNYGSAFESFFPERKKNDEKDEDDIVAIEFPRYAIVFEIDADDETQNMSPDEENEYNRKKVCGLIPPEPWDRLLSDIHYNETSSERRYPQLLQSDFCNVYNKPPVTVPYREWRFETKFNNTTIQDSVRVEEYEPSVVIYSTIPTEDDIDNTILGGYTQSERLYKAVLDKINLNVHQEINFEAAEEHAKDEILNNPPAYNMIKKSTLRSDLFDPGGDGQGWRIKFKILKAIIQDRHGISWGVGKIKKRRDELIANK